jgi:hypothetical protein
MNRRAAKFLIVGGILAFGVLGGLFIGHSPSERPGVDIGSNSFSLVAPAFAQGIPSDQFPMNEAGISAYVNAGQAIDLGKAKTIFQVLEEVTSNYVIGTVKLSEHGEDFWPHAYVDREGWILVYYPKAEPMSKLFQWVGYKQDVITTTTLRDTLLSLGRNLGLDISKLDAEMCYYDFEHPDATKLLIVVDTGGSDSFQYTIPSGINVYDAYASHYATGIWSNYSSGTNIDGASLLSGGGGTYTRCGQLKEKHLTPSVAHEVTFSSSGGGWVGIALLFLYR